MSYTCIDTQMRRLGTFLPNKSYQIVLPPRCKNCLSTGSTDWKLLDEVQQTVRRTDFGGIFGYVTTVRTNYRNHLRCSVSTSNLETIRLIDWCTANEYEICPYLVRSLFYIVCRKYERRHSLTKPIKFPELAIMPKHLMVRHVLLVERNNIAGTKSSTSGSLNCHHRCFRTHTE